MNIFITCYNAFLRHSTQYNENALHFIAKFNIITKYGIYVVSVTRYNTNSIETQFQFEFSIVYCCMSVNNYSKSTVYYSAFYL